ncbi:hypothetical protein [Streptomyces sp. NPDC048438]|uniref:hypothetical protein n=1 Tax=Streptomyces sp. NPDC048438 TaxID=3365551 RepID=UPI00371D8652
MRAVLRSTAVTLMAGGALFFTMSNPAAAAESNTGVVGGSPGSTATCISTISGAKACFQRYGDVIWTKDTSGDGYSVYTNWTNQLKQPSGTWKTYRTGKCSNPGSSGDNASCNKDFYESSSTNAYGGKGSRIQVSACVASLGDDECQTTTWINNDS